MKKIIITGGPTNEPIDEVMKITNMSTGSLSTYLASLFLEAGYRVCLILNKGVAMERVMAAENALTHLKLRAVETTDEMMQALHEESLDGEKTDVLIHASAVGDFKTDYTFLMEDLAAYLWKKMENREIGSEEELLAALTDGERYRIDNSSKISSYQKNLTVKLGLTPKIIGRLREWYPDTLLIGCKLLENVPKEELYEVGQRLCVKNQMDYIMANDLADLRSGDSARHLITQEGFTGKILETPADIFDFVDSCLSENK